MGICVWWLENFGSLRFQRGEGWGEAQFNNVSMMVAASGRNQDGPPAPPPPPPPPRATEGDPGPPRALPSPLLPRREERENRAWHSGHYASLTSRVASLPKQGGKSKNHKKAGRFK